MSRKEVIVNNLKPEERVVVQQGRPGYRSISYKKSPKGTSVVSRDYYTEKTEIVHVGAGKPLEASTAAPTGSMSTSWTVHSFRILRSAFQS